jgi:hypothetical protein
VKYLLTILSTGRAVYRERMEASLGFLQPPPSSVFLHEDTGREGMCAAHAHCWDAAAVSDCDWVFHIEEDQVLLRPTDLTQIMEVLNTNDHLAQIALVRCPWGFEIEHGGYIPQSPGWYERRSNSWGEWIETTRNWATAPALFRTDLASEFPWDPSPGCETEIGQRIIEKRPDARFGLWGWGEPWCAHIGIERAEGSHGY